MRENILFSCSLDILNPELSHKVTHATMSPGPQQTYPPACRARFQHLLRYAATHGGPPSSATRLPASCPLLPPSIPHSPEAPAHLITAPPCGKQQPLTKGQAGGERQAATEVTAEWPEGCSRGPGHSPGHTRIPEVCPQALNLGHSWPGGGGVK